MGKLGNTSPAGGCADGSQEEEAQVRFEDCSAKGTGSKGWPRDGDKPDSFFAEAGYFGSKMKSAPEFVPNSARNTDFPSLEVNVQVSSPSAGGFHHTPGLRSVLELLQVSTVVGQGLEVDPGCCSPGHPDREIWPVAGHEICLNGRFPAPGMTKLPLPCRRGRAKLLCSAQRGPGATSLLVRMG